ncbi:unnamed protein product [Brassica rapa subsp. trilocularis]
MSIEVHSLVVDLIRVYMWHCNDISFAKFNDTNISCSSIFKFEIHFKLNFFVFLYILRRCSTIKISNLS